MDREIEKRHPVLGWCFWHVMCEIWQLMFGGLVFLAKK